MKRFALLLAALGLLGVTGTAWGRVINVPDDCETIQAGIDSSSDGDTVLVAPGRYVENINFGGRAITVASWFLTGWGEAGIDSTIIDGNDAYSVVRFDHDEGPNSILMGFTITNGGGSEDLDHSNAGGGIICIQASPTLRYLKVRKNSATYGGGIFLQESKTLIEFVEVDHDTAWFGSGIRCSREKTDAEIRFTSIHHNVAQNNGGGLECWRGAKVNLDRVTIADNHANYGGGITTNSAEAGNVVNIANCIIYGNSPDQISLGSVEAHGDTASISWSDIEGGRDSIDLNYQTLVWGEGNIDEDPQFINPDSGDYRIPGESPCFDAGDPDSEPDPDGTRADMGAVYWWPEFRAFLGGEVRDSETDLPIVGAMIFGQSGRFGFTFHSECDSTGVWGGWLGSCLLDSVSAAQLNIRADGYLPVSMDTEIVIGDSVWIETLLDHGEFLANRDSIAIQVDSGGATQVPLTLSNNGNGLLTWEYTARARGDAGADDWEVRQSLPVSDITHNRYIQGVVFDGESYYCAGDGRGNYCLIYRISLEGALLDTFPQPGNSRHEFSDMEWDGEWIWGCDADSVYGLNRDGEVRTRWRSLVTPTSNIAYEPEEGVLWISGITSDIYAYDIGGNYLDKMIPFANMQIYGLAWFADDPDSASLYAISAPSNGAHLQMVKINTRSGEIIQVYKFAVCAPSLKGAYICRNFDRYKNWVLMTILNVLDGDRLQVIQLQRNDEWLTVDPNSGEIPPGEEAQATVTICTASEDGDWGFDPRDYFGEIVFTHDGFGGEAILPVQLTVNAIPEASDQPDPKALPAEFSLQGPTPNPFNGHTTIRYTIPIAANTRLSVYDLEGRRVTTLADAYAKAGQYSVLWNASAAPSGIYLLKMEAGGHSVTRRAVLMR